MQTWFKTLTPSVDMDKSLIVTQCLNFPICKMELVLTTYLMRQRDMLGTRGGEEGTEGLHL